METRTICIVAILRDELKFVDEWLAYHRLLGVDHFYLYDDEPGGALARYILPHKQYTTVVPWHRRHKELAGRNKQTKAYTHSLPEVRNKFEWVCFLDLDEFIVLKQDPDTKTFLDQFSKAASVSLFWRVFGDNDYFNNPRGLVTASLTRRQRKPGRQYKSLTRTSAIESITSAHKCMLRSGCERFDANGKIFRSDAVELDEDGEHFSAYVNHYYCRSFRHWMARPARGATTDGENLPSEKWKSDTRTCFRLFVKKVAVDFNEYPDHSLVNCEKAINDYLGNLKMGERHSFFWRLGFYRARLISLVLRWIGGT